MRCTTRNRLKLASLALCLLTSLLFASLKSHSQVPQSTSPSGADERDRVLVLGKKIFVERCARCHDEHGDKPLKSGPPLSERNLSEQDIARLASGRLKDAPDEEKRAVALYVSSLMKRK
jgi:mono/diheme cytochrome c family protein